MANPTLTPFPTPPLPEQDEATFNRNAANSLLAQANFVGEGNVMITWMGQQVTDVTTYKGQAAASAAAAAQSVTDAAAQVTLATTQAGKAKTSADAAAASLASSETVAAAVRAQVSLPSLAGKAGQYWRVASDEKTLELVPLVVSQIGDTIISTQAPDSSWVSTGAILLQSQFPKLYAKLGIIADWRPDQSTSSSVNGSYSWGGFAFGSGKFVFQGAYNNNYYIVYSSDNGATWSYSASPYSSLFTSMIWTGSQFVGVSSSLSVFTASDSNPSSWSSWNVLPSASNTYYSIAYGNGVFLALGDGGGRYARRAGSINSTAWTAQTMPDSFSPNSIVFALGMFVAIANNSSIYYTSTDGSSWTRRTLPVAFVSSSRFAATDSIAVAMMDNGQAYVSTDLANWQVGGRILGFGINGMYSGAGNLIVATNSPGNFFVSVDGVKWVQKALGYSLLTSGPLVYGNGYFLSPRYNDSYVFRIRAISYATGSQFYSVDQAQTAIGLNQYIKGA